MSKVLFRRMQRLEERLKDSRPPEPGWVGFEGQEPPEGWAGPVVRIQVFDGKRPVQP